MNKIIFGQTHTIRKVYSFHFRSNLLLKKCNVYSPRTFSVILQSQIWSSLFGHLNNPH